ncbi:isoprenoid synthase domain-containing protein [Stachybotrys elegans]|uniref:Terpene synthase n=1 Tax=Stachybotrys elegans TaxID=80388 RepID=A0A8K0T2F4_9HYPO|nr:isoprenoid synthase domain-containing protein [Stachybotrys elegans]
MSAPAPSASASASASAAAAALRGQTLRVPDLKALFRTWPQRRNPHYAALQPFVTDILRRLATTHAPIGKRIADDLALLATALYPQASWDELQGLALFTIWIVCWDDIVDANEGDLSADFSKAQAWRALTLRIAELALGMAAPLPGEHVPVPDPINALLDDFARRVCASCDAVTCKRLYDEMAFFITSCGVEQSMRLEGKIPPDYQSYMEIRSGTIAGEVFTWMVPFAASIRPMPRAIADSPATKTMAREICVIQALFNDLLSLKKELSTDCVINAVTALLEPGKTLDEVVDEVVGILRNSIALYDEAAAELLRAVAGDEEATLAADKFIEGGRLTVTGLVDFT